MRLLAFMGLIAHSGNIFVCANKSFTLGRIIRGHDATKDQFPYVVRLLIRSENLKDSVCGGALISTAWVLTAAHCVANCKSVKVYLGSIYTNRRKVSYNVSISDITIHPYFETRGFYHDIALIKIPPTKSFETKIVRLPRIGRSNQKYEKAFAKICGWGRTSMSGKTAKKLQWGRVQILGGDGCKHITRDEFCTAIDSDLATTCFGDSGGPVVLETTGELVGIVSSGCGENREKGITEAIYARVSSYLNWIKSVAGVCYGSLF